MTFPSRAWALLLLALAPTAWAATPEAASTARELACSLADEVGARLAGSEGDARAVAWALAKMKALGLSNVHAEAVKVPHWERGEASGELVAPFKRRLVLAALGGSVATPPGGVEAEVVRVESLEALKALPTDAVSGRIVFLDKVMERLASGDSYGKTVDVRVQGATEAAKLGAVAVVIRSVGTTESRFPHTGTMRYSDGGAKIPAAALAIPDAELLRRAVLRGQGPVRLRLVLTSRKLEDADSANVIGEVPGSTHPQELVLLGAHLDSWDLGDGAVDDAAGVGLVLDVAARLVKARPARTVRVVLFANEENGLKGAKGYVLVHRGELPKHVAAMELDSGAGRPLGVKFQGGSNAAAALAPLAKALGLPVESSDEAGGADTGELEGVPLVSVVQDCARYFDVHHTADDTCDKIHADEIGQVSEVALAVTRHLAQAGLNLGGRKPKAAPEPATGVRK